VELEGVLEARRRGFVRVLLLMPRHDCIFFSFFLLPYFSLLCVREWTTPSSSMAWYLRQDEASSIMEDRC
jgi:hypothetical protein